jgi:alpha-galactosidase
VIDVGDQRLPRILHWGEFLGDIDAPELEALADAAQPAIGDSPVTYPQPVPVLAQLGEGWLGRPGLIGDADGRAWAPVFRLERHQVTGDADGPLLRVVATDKASELELELELQVLHRSGLVRQRAHLRNRARTAHRVGRLELALPVPAEADELLDLTGRWSLEKVPQRRAFDVGEWVRASRGGKPGLEHTMLLIAGVHGFGFRSGRVWGTHLAWSGNQELTAERVPANSRRLAASESLTAGEMTLAPGDEYTTPWQFGSWGDGLDELAARFHRHLRDRPRRPDVPRPVVLNTWEAVYFRHDPVALARLADIAASIGVERFVVDDGWFTGRHDDTTSLGDWDVDTTVWPEGLGPLADRVHELGMEFGLWFEPEMVNLDSNLARAHPEWLFDAGHGNGLPSRHQHVLDLGHEDAYQYVLNRMSSLIGELGIDAVKWDHNRYLLDAGHTPDGKPGLRVQTLAVYRMMDDLRRAHPDLEIETCASGGGRIDLGVLEYAARVWPSDTNDPHERLEIQRWTGLLVPPEMQGTHIGAEVSHTTSRSHPLDYRAEKALWGNLGVEVNLLEADDDERAAIAGWIEFHRAHRRLLHTGTVVHADLSEPALRLEGVVADDRSEALYAVSLVERPRTWPPGRVGLPGLDDDQRYDVHAVFPGMEPNASVPQPPWLVDGVRMTGRTLRVAGLEAPTLDVDRSMLLRVVAAPG